jgi:phospholipid/cholesterol/gamma-HCH transport system substrate-binding protein
MFMPRPRRHPYALYGVAMLTVVTLLATFCILVFQQTFKSFTPVTMHISRAGLQLLKGSDVKMRGVIVGDVDSITSNGNGATIKLRITPKYASDIPQNVGAQLIPKTIFGEKYVDLIPPANPSPQHIAAGGVIAEDRTKPALEIDQALNDLLPLLRTVRPQDLNSTLSAMASALSGRGDKLGQTMVQFDAYLKQLNPHMPQIQHDFQALAKLATTYDEAAPALLALLRNTTVTGDTITSRAQTLSAFLRQMTGAANVTHDFLARNEQNIIQVNSVNRNFLALLAEYSPEYNCLFTGVANLLPRVKSTKDTPHTAKVLLEFHGPKPSYQYPIDKPELADTRGPGCYGLPNPPMQLPYIQFADGTQDDPRFYTRNGKTDAQPFNPNYNSSDGGVGAAQQSQSGTASGNNPLSSVTSQLGPSDAATPGSPDMGTAGSPSELAWMDQLLGPILGRPANKVPAIAGLLWGPMARGAEVDVG